MASTFERVCEQCLTTFETKSGRARFCGSTCRSRSHRGKPAIAAVPDPAEPKGRGKKRAASTSSSPAKSEPATAPTYDALEKQLRASLTDANALDTIAGMAALRIAQQIDRGRDSGSAVATLSKELSRLVEAAKVEAAPRNRDATDDILDVVNNKLLRLVGS